PSRSRLAGDRPQLRCQCDRRLRRFGVDGLRTGRHRRMERDLPPWLCLDGDRRRSAVAVAALRAGLRGDVVGRGALDGLARLDPEDLTAAVHCPITARRYARRMRATNTGRGRRTMRRPLTPAERDAVEAGLRYVSDTDPGIRRMRCGRGFRYLDPDGGTVRDVDTLARIRSLAIPPAYREVWICRSPRGHLQATGRDARGRKQYRYHPDWRPLRDANKFDRIVAFGRALPKLRQRVRADLALPGLPREKVLA